MDQSIIVAKVEKFLKKEFGAVPEIVIAPEIVTAIGGEQRMVGCSVRLEFKVLKNDFAHTKKTFSEEKPPETVNVLNYVPRSTDPYVVD